MEKLTLSGLEQHLAKAAWLLKGPVDAADFKVYIFPLLFLSASVMCTTKSFGRLLTTAAATRITLN